MSNKQPRQTQTVTPQKDKRRGVYVLRWTDLYGERRQEATDIPLTKANYKRAMVAAHSKELDLATGQAMGFVGWFDFQMQYQDEYLSSLSEASRKKWSDAVKRVDEFLDLFFVSDLDSRKLSYLYSKLKTATYGKGKRKKTIAQGTIDGYFRSILAALSWAAEQQMITAVPKFRIAKQQRKKSAKTRKSKGRSLTLEEHERMKVAATAVRDSPTLDDAADWIYLLDVLWFSGLRFAEALSLSWDWSDPFAVSLDVKYPRYVIDGDAQKSGKDEMLPIAPEFVEMLKAIPRGDREGNVLKWQYSESWTTKVLIGIGQKANVKVNAKGKCASAHDYRRSFGTRWAPKLTPIDLQKLMRHESFATTQDFYVDMPADELGARLWAAVENQPPKPASGASAAQKKKRTAQN